MRIEALSYLPFDCPSSPEDFFSGKISKNLGYIPGIGTIVGVSRIIFSSYQYARGAPRWSQDRFVQELITGTFEALWLGPVLFIYDYFFSKVQQLDPAFSFTPLNSNSFLDHAAPLVAAYVSKLPTSEQLSRFQTYTSTGLHAWQGRNLFNGADFYTRHGVMHACFVAMFIPVFVSLYRQAGHAEAAQLSSEDVLGLQVTGFFHDYGRILEGKDLTGDNEHMESMGEKAAFHYMRDAMGFSEERARRLSRCTMTKDAPLAGKSLIQQVLQNCDCLAVLRADDWIFDPNYLDLLKWIRLNVPEGPTRQSVLEELNRVIDSAKTLLANMGDSPYSMACYSQARRGQTIQGNFSLTLKRVYEKSPRCYQMILGHLRNDPVLSRYV